MILSPSESIMKKPIQYSSNKVEARYNFPVCSRENHKILFNNFACNYEKTFNDLKISKSQVDLFEGSLDGISKKLVITIRPANEKIDALNRLKSGFYTIETGGYECLQIQPSF